MGKIKKILKRGLLALASRRGQGDDWRQNLEYNAPGAVKRFAGDMVFTVLAVVLAVMFAAAGVYEFIFASPLTKVAGKAVNVLSQTTPAQVSGNIMNLPKQDLANKPIGDMMGSVAAGASPLMGALGGLVDETVGILIIITAVIVRFGHHLLGLFIGEKPANKNGAVLSWITLGIAFTVFVFGSLI